MKGNYWGKLFGITTFGESHGPAIGVVIEDVKPGIDFPYQDIRDALERRRPGKSEFGSSRYEKDELVVLSGVFEGKTTGMPICMVVYNSGQRPEDYESIKDIFRPGHADLSLFRKFKIYDYRGGGRTSGRETISRVAAGALVSKLIEPVEILLYPVSIGKIAVKKIDHDFIKTNELYWPCPETYDRLITYLQGVKESGDSAGGVVQCIIEKIPEGLGDPVFEKLDANLSKAIVSIGGVKGIEFGAGFSLARMQGSEANDPITSSLHEENNGKMGGIYGGITTGEPVSFRFSVKPAPSISIPQITVDRDNNPQMINLQGRFDTCLIPRIIPVAEAMIKLVLADAISYQRLVREEKPDLDQLREVIDKTDEDILLALLRRDRIVGQIAGIKKREEIAVHQPGREAEMLKNLKQKSEDLGLDPDFIEEIWQMIFAHSRGKQ